MQTLSSKTCRLVGVGEAERVGKPKGAGKTVGKLWASVQRLWVGKTKGTGTTGGNVVGVGAATVTGGAGTAVEALPKFADDVVGNVVGVVVAAAVAVMGGVVVAVVGDPLSPLPTAVVCIFIHSYQLPSRIPRP